MKIENIDTAKRLRDEIMTLNELLESSSISNVTITFYNKNRYKKKLIFTDETIFQSIKTRVKDKKDRLENELNEIL